MNEQKDMIQITLNVEKIRKDVYGFKAHYKSQFFFVNKKDLVSPKDLLIDFMNWFYSIPHELTDHLSNEQVASNFLNREKE